MDSNECSPPPAYYTPPAPQPNPAPTYERPQSKRRSKHGPGKRTRRALRWALTRQQYDQKLLERLAARFYAQPCAEPPVHCSKAQVKSDAASGRRNIRVTPPTGPTHAHHLADLAQWPLLSSTSNSQRPLHGNSTTIPPPPPAPNYTC